jgi:hypothetical protein
MEIIISLALCNGFSSPSFLPDSAHFSLPVSLAPKRSAQTALEDFSPKNKKPTRLASGLKISFR